MPKPASGTPLNLSNGLAAKLLRAFTFNEGSGGFVDDVANTTYTPSGGTWRDGDNLRPSNDSNSLSIGAVTSASQSHSVTISIEATASCASGGGFPIAFSRFTSDSDATELFTAAENDWRSGSLTMHIGRFFSGGQVAVSAFGSPEVLTLVAEVGSNYELYRNGVLVGTGPTVAISSAPDWYIGGRAGSLKTDGNRYNYFFIHDGALDSTEIASLHSDPWQQYGGASPASPLTSRRTQAGRRALLPV